MLSIIIPTYNGKSLLKENINFLLYSLKDIETYEIIVVDNNSSDGTEKVVSELKNINYLKLEKNYGFTGAVNRGVKQAKGKYVLILNNDCLLKEDTVIEMIEFLETHTQYIATQPIVYKSETHEIENIGYVVDLWKAKAEPIRERKGFLDFDRYSPVPVFVRNDKGERYLYGLSATCLLIKRDVFVKMGKFDEKFHSYLEDVDLFIRLAKAGHRYYPTLTASCFHVHMATSSKMGSYKEKKDLVNWIRIINKNYPLLFIILHFPALFIERLRNISGLIKKTAKIKNHPYSV